MVDRRVMDQWEEIVQITSSIDFIEKDDAII
jgi:hypothetical protein